MTNRKGYQKQYYQKNKTKINEHIKQYRQEHPQKARQIYIKTKLKQLYGISLEDYRLLLQRQNGRCKICCRLPYRKRLSVDHNHQTGKVRGLLCHSCNTGLGLFRESVVVFRRIIGYLNEN